MSVRVLIFSAAAMLAPPVVLAADGDAPASKPVLNGAPSTLNDQLLRRSDPVIERSIIRAPVDSLSQSAPASDPGYTIFGPPPAPEAGPVKPAGVLPVEIVFHNMKNADCHPKDAAPAELKKLQASAACMALAKETEQFKIAYKDNPRVLDALVTGALR